MDIFIVFFSFFFFIVKEFLKFVENMTEFLYPSRSASISYLLLTKVSLEKDKVAAYDLRKRKGHDRFSKSVLVGQP